MSRVLALGFFDGVHIGHGQLFKYAARRASRLGVSACALTYDTHPQTLITGRPVPLLCSTEERAGLIRTLYRIPEVVVDPFTGETARIPWREYVDRVLIERLEAVFVVAGYDFAFGYKGEGSPALLSAYCAERGVGCAVIPPKRLEGVRVSSTYIRGLVAEGDMERAGRFLGHRYRLSGTVQRGRGLGRKFGFPTVNLPMPPERQPPAWGVYATRVIWDGRAYPAVTNVGIRPTVETGGAPTVESTLLDFTGDLYGERIDVEFARFVRPERRFDSPGSLTEQVRRDMGAVRELFGMAVPGK
ncbi:MAG: riboflavin biosynthesis protein RibF [Oscillospiraceae bacterium]|jgi:riboflavin kinase/FMN adenylyltransferase|nr:riboflavin biosynthesis protein RibF [Oscillospiraceae bacterium]